MLPGQGFLHKILVVHMYKKKSPATTLLVTSNHKLEELKGKIRLFNAYKWLAYHFNPHCLKVQVT